MIGRSHQDVYVDSDGTVHNHRRESAEARRDSWTVTRPTPQNKPPSQTCDKCGSDDVDKIHHQSTAALPECHTWRCAECGNETDPN